MLQSSIATPPVSTSANKPSKKSNPLTKKTTSKSISSEKDDSPSKKKEKRNIVVKNVSVRKGTKIKSFKALKDLQ